MIIDSHAHIFPPEVQADRAKYLCHEEACALIYGDPAAKMVESSQLIQAMDEDGVDKSVVCSFPWRDIGRASMHNDYILAEAGAHPDRLIPLAAVDPLAKGALKEAERALAAGAAGLGEIGVYYSDLGAQNIVEALKPLFNLCAEAGKPIMIHTNEPIGHNYPGKSPMTIRGLYRCLKACGQAKMVLAHMGGGIFFYELLKKEVAELMANVYYDTAAAPYLYRPEMYQVFSDICGPDRLLYGSDYPLLGLKRYLKDMDAAGLTKALKAKILGQNARRFWGV